MLRIITDSETGRSLPLFRSSAQPVRFGPGFYEEERDDLHRFRWMQPAGVLHFEPREQERFLELWVFCCFYDLSQRLEIAAGSPPISRLLPNGWTRLSLPVAAGVAEMALRVSKPFPPSHYPEDSRTLSIRVRSGASIHADPERHRRVEQQYANQVRNWQEVLAGSTVLESTPPVLGIDLHGACNVKPPCVYCDWDTSKQMEGDQVDVPFTRETLDRYGELFDQSQSLVNCSIGEPFMMKNLDELFDIFGDRGKVLEMTTNGQILTDRNIEKLLRRDIELYISLDAATPETYSRLRNDRFEQILVNLRRLIAAKGGRDGLPRVHLVFMPMRCNVHELEAFVELCACLEVDRLVLRPLNYSEAMDLKWERQGYVFDYPKELLPFQQLIEISARARELCRQHDVPFSDQLDFGGELEERFAAEPGVGGSPVVRPADRNATETAPTLPSSPEPDALSESPGAVSEDGGAGDGLGEQRLPACVEPWTSLYILRRGVLPCCYGGHPIAAAGEFASTWNSKTVRQIRAELAAGRFHRYCLRSPACPIVRKDEHADALPRSQALFLRARQVLQRLDRRSFGVPGRVYRWVKKSSRRVRGRPAGSRV